MLRLFIEFLGVKADKDKPGRLTKANRKSDSILMDAFRKWGVRKLEPGDFGTDEKLISEVHQVLCKINAHFTYKNDPKRIFYDRIESPNDETEWKPAVEIVVRKLDEYFYQKVRQPITVHFDLEEDFKTQFTDRLKLKSAVKGDGLGQFPMDRRGLGLH